MTCASASRNPAAWRDSSHSRDRHGDDKKLALVCRQGSMVQDNRSVTVRLGAKRVKQKARSERGLEYEAYTHELGPAAELRGKEGGR